MRTSRLLPHFSARRAVRIAIPHLPLAACTPPNASDTTAPLGFEPIQLSWHSTRDFGCALSQTFDKPLANMTVQSLSICETANTVAAHPAGSRHCGRCGGESGTAGRRPSSRAAPAASAAPPACRRCTPEDFQGLGFTPVATAPGQGAAEPSGLTCRDCFCLRAHVCTHLHEAAVQNNGPIAFATHQQGKRR